MGKFKSLVDGPDTLAALVLLAAACSFFPTAVFAQALPFEPAAVQASRDRMGVNLSTGTLTINNVDLSVGSGDFPSRLALNRTYGLSGMPAITTDTNGAYGNMGEGNQFDAIAYFTCQICNNNHSGTSMRNVTAIVFGHAYHFTGALNVITNPNLLSEDDDGSTMRVINPTQSSWQYELITHDGVRVLFTDTAGYAYDSIGGRYAQYAEFPDGDFITFTYANSPTLSGVSRLTGIYNSRGYGLTFSYLNSRLADARGLTTYYNDTSLIGTVTAVRASCVSDTSVNCSTGALASVSYAYSNGYLTSATNSLSGVTSYVYDSYGRLFKGYKPNSSTIPYITVTYINGVSDNVGTVNWISSVEQIGNDNGFSFSPQGPSEFQYSDVSTITDGAGNVTNYNFSGPDGSARIATVTAPDGAVDTYYSDDYYYGQPYLPEPFLDYSPTRWVNANGKLTQFTHDNHGRPTSVTYPEGDIVKMTRDANGNVTEFRHIAKPGSGLPDQVTSAGYWTCNSTTYRYCNKPAFVTDPLGHRWDYEYDTASGLLAGSLAPADNSNKRAISRNTLSAFSYAPSVPVPAGIIPPQAQYITSVSTCLSSSVAGTTIDFSYTCPVSDRRLDLFNYAASTDSARTGHELESVTLDSDHVAATTKTGYDQVGNIISRTGPLSASQIQYFTFDVLRRKVFDIGVDPDGTGPLPRAIVHHVYDANSNEIRTEAGSGQAIDGSDFIVQSFLRRTFASGTDWLVKTEQVQP